MKINTLTLIQISQTKQITHTRLDELVSCALKSGLGVFTT